MRELLNEFIRKKIQSVLPLSVNRDFTVVPSTGVYIMVIRGYSKIRLFIYEKKVQSLYFTINILDIQHTDR